MHRELSETGSTSRLVTVRGSGRAKDWDAVVKIARRQHGVVGLAQMLAHGFSPAGVVSLVQANRMHRIHREVYALGPAALGPLGLRMAAVLAGGPGSLLATRSAAGHLELIANASSRIDVMATRRIRRAGIRGHAMPALAERDRIEHLGIPCTSVARTLLDLAAEGRPGELRSALERADEIGIFDLRALNDVIERNRGGRGVRRLRAALLPLSMTDERFRSEFERRFRPICRSAGSGEPLVNHVIELPDGPLEVDFYLPDLNLVVETDGYKFHRDRRRFRADRRRDRRLAAAGIQTLRYVWEDLDDPAAIRRELIEAARFRVRRSP